MIKKLLVLSILFWAFSTTNDFPEFEIDTGSKKYEFERLGDNNFYTVGLDLEVKCVRSKYILPTSGIEETLTPLIISVL